MNGRPKFLPSTLLLSTFILCAPQLSALASESTMPAGFVETISPELASKYKFTEDGEFTKKLNIPTYEWMPTAAPPRAIVIAIHGLTLHGRRYRVLARMLAANDVGVVSLDMRGFGRCRFDEKKQFSTAGDDKAKVNHEKSYEDIVQLARLVKDKYPGLKIIVMGESLGCTFCVRLGAEHPELADAMVLSAPAVRLNTKMFFGHGTAARGIKAVFTPTHEINLHSFFEYLVSNKQLVVNEMIDDPQTVKSLSLRALLSTDKFVSKTASYGKGISEKMPILILQGSKDSCVSPKEVTKLMSAMPSSDQTLAWRSNYGHLQLETVYMRTAIIDAVINFLRDHSKENIPGLRAFQQQIIDAGGTLAD
ncbi:MAG: alpha/beta fold hydrolase [Candidatus Melainabacteria bacterium]|nr:alpha/beta fold hydrolase [Candidatus Melainabacteria bacterium]